MTARAGTNYKETVNTAKVEHRSCYGSHLSIEAVFGHRFNMAIGVFITVLYMI